MLREEKARLQAEMDKVTKVATLVGSRLARLVMDARRSSTGNTQLVEELKRYNRRLEVPSPLGLSHRDWQAGWYPANRLCRCTCRLP